MFRCILRRPYSTYRMDSIKKLSIPDLMMKYQSNTPMVMLTAHDFITATWAQQAAADLILVGDSLAMTTLGFSSTTSLTVDEMIYHLKSVSRAKGNSVIVCDMPFGSYETSVQDALSNAYKLMKSAENLSSVKIECGIGDEYSMKVIKEICQRGIPVMGHIGLTPQRMHSLGGFKVQSKTSKEALELLKCAQSLEKAGCWSLVLECIPEKIAEWITQNINIPAIGIGAGRNVSGQVLVVSDMLGMLPGGVPKFAKKYGSLMESAQQSIEQYINEVKTKQFPSEEHVFKVKREVLESLKNVKTKS